MKRFARCAAATEAVLTFVDLAASGFECNLKTQALESEAVQLLEDANQGWLAGGGHGAVFRLNHNTGSHSGIRQGFVASGRAGA
jgi:hypothetical protein